jgi:hypothetical protein
MMSFEGSGDLQTGEPGKSQSNALVSDPDAPVECRSGFLSLSLQTFDRNGSRKFPNLRRKNMSARNSPKVLCESLFISRIILAKL